MADGVPGWPHPASPRAVNAPAEQDHRAFPDGATVGSDQWCADVLQSALRWLTEVSGAERGALFLVNPDGSLALGAPVSWQEGEDRVDRDAAPPAAGPPLRPVPAGPAAPGTPLREPTVVDLADAFAAAELDPVLLDLCASACEEGFRSGLLLPLTTGSRAVGLYAGLFASAEPPLLATDRLVALQGSAEAAARLLHTALDAGALQEERDRIARVARLYAELAAGILEGRSPAALAATAARILHGTVVIEDRHLHPLAVGRAGLPGATETPAPVQSPELSPALKKDLQVFLKTLVTSRRPAPVPDRLRDRLGPRLMVALVAGGRHLGFLSLLGGPEAAGPADPSLVEAAAGLLGLKLMQERVASEVEENIKQDFLYNVVTSNYSSERAILEKAAYLGYDLTRPLQAILIAIVDALTADPVVPSREHLARIKEEVAADYPGSIVGGLRDRYLFVLYPPEHPVAPASFAQALARKLVETTSQSYYVGIGRVTRSVGDIRGSYEEAKRTIGILQQMKQRNSIASYEELGAYSLLFGMESMSELEHFVVATLGGLIEYDQRHGTSYIDLLNHYLFSSESQEALAARMHIHPNTLKYRLRKIEEISGVSLKDPEDRFNLQLALKAKQVAKAARAVR